MDTRKTNNKFVWNNDKILSTEINLVEEKLHFNSYGEPVKHEKIYFMNSKHESFVRNIQPKKGNSDIVKTYTFDPQHYVFIKKFVLDIFDGLSDPTGFITPEGAKCFFDKITRKFTIEPDTANGYEYYDYVINGIKRRENQKREITLSDEWGVHLIYINEDDELIDDVVPPEVNILKDVVFVWMVNWNVVQQKSIISGNEKHQLLPHYAHRIMHFSNGMRFVAGGDITYTLGSGSVDADAQIALTDVLTFDEDIDHLAKNVAVVNNQYEQILSAVAQLPILYRLGANGEWYEDDPTGFITKITGGIGGWAVKNVWSGTEWIIEDVTNNNYGIMYVVKTNDSIYPVKLICGQHEAVSIGNIKNFDWYDVQLGGFVSPESKLLYTLYFQTANAMTNSVKTALIEVVDHRRENTIHLDVANFL